MKAQILTEIDVHADGVHCGENCQEKITNAQCSMGVCLNNIRCKACLSGQKDAEGMTDKARAFEQIKLIRDLTLGKLILISKRVLGGGNVKQNERELVLDDLEHCISKVIDGVPLKDGDRFRPVPVKEKE